MRGVIRAAMAQAGIKPRQLTYTEAHVLEGTDAFTDGAEPSDDLTLLVLRRPG